MLEYCTFLFYSLQSGQPAGEDANPKDEEMGLGQYDDHIRLRAYDEFNGEEEEGEADEPTWKGIAYLVVGGVLIATFSKPFIDFVRTTAAAAAALLTATLVSLLAAWPSVAYTGRRDGSLAPCQATTRGVFLGAHSIRGTRNPGVGITLAQREPAEHQHCV